MRHPIYLEDPKGNPVSTDDDAIRERIVDLCELPVVFGTPAPEGGYTPRRNGPEDGQPVTLRYTVSVEVGGFSTVYTYPVGGKAYYHHARVGVDMGGGWCAVPARDRLPKVGDVLGCLLQDTGSGSDTFADFCDTLGYDVDSRKALDTYLKCQDCLGAMRRAFGARLELATELACQL